MTAALRPHLVLEHERRHTGFLEGAHDEVHGHRIAVARVGVSAQQQFSAIGKAARVIEILVESHDAAIGPAHAALGNAGA